jgi:hypothetical protein
MQEVRRSLVQGICRGDLAVDRVNVFSLGEVCAVDVATASAGFSAAIPVRGECEGGIEAGIDGTGLMVASDEEPQR